MPKHSSLPTLLLSALLCLLPILSTAQDFSPIQTGPRLTLDIIWPQASTLNIQGGTGQDSVSIGTGKTDVDYGLGMFMQFNLADYFFIRPEALISMSKRRLIQWPITQAPIGSRLFRFHLPVQLGYRIEGVSLQAGLVWHSQLRGEPFKDNPPGLEQRFKSSYTSYSIGLGYQSNWLLVDLHYDSPFGKVEDDILFNGGEHPFPTRPRALSLRLGFVLAGRD